jgi:uncharacterized membrane protein
VRAALVAIELLAASVWVGGLVAIAVVARCAREQLEPAARVGFFRSLGRRYLRVGGTALVVAYAAGALLLRGGGWTDLDSAIVAAAAALVAVTLAGVVQARALTRLRAALLAGDPRLDAGYVARRARRAGALRGLIAAATVTLVVLAALDLG